MCPEIIGARTPIHRCALPSPDARSRPALAPPPANDHANARDHPAWRAAMAELSALHARKLDGTAVSSTSSMM